MIQLQEDVQRQYFQRIGYTDKPAADLATLKALHQLHPASIPFENIDVLLDAGIDLTLDRISHKLIDRHRGGYCFEQNNLLMAVLRNIGFVVEPLMARVHWQLPADAPANPRSHMVLRTFVDGIPWLVDVGFGGLVLTAPLQLIPGILQTTQHETFRLIEHSYGYMLEVELNDGWQPVYQLGTEPQLPIDIEVANWYTSAHPDSKFRHVLMAARATEDTRYTLLNNRLTIRKHGESPLRKVLNADALATVLESNFLLPVDTKWQKMLQRLTE